MTSGWPFKHSGRHAIYWTIVSIDTKVWGETTRQPLSNLNGPIRIPQVVRHEMSTRQVGGLSLIMMRERASQLNGKFEFEGARGRGTTIRVVIPFR